MKREVPVPQSSMFYAHWQVMRTPTFQQKNWFTFHGHTANDTHKKCTPAFDAEICKYVLSLSLTFWPFATEGPVKVH